MSSSDEETTPTRRQGDLTEETPVQSGQNAIPPSGSLRNRPITTSSAWEDRYGGPSRGSLRPFNTYSPGTYHTSTYTEETWQESTSSSSVSFSALGGTISHSASSNGPGDFWDRVFFGGIILFIAAVWLWAIWGWWTGDLTLVDATASHSAPVRSCWSIGIPLGPLYLGYGCNGFFWSFSF